MVRVDTFVIGAGQAGLAASLHKRKSAPFCGVGEDAEHVVSQLVAL